MQAQKEIEGISLEAKSSPSQTEFIIIISMMFSLMALSIDAMLPALPGIANDLGVATPNQRQLIISMIFFGAAFGQLIFGPISDHTGRKPAIYAGYGLYILGSLVSVFSLNFPMMLTGRIFQGLGISTSQSVGMALVRDRFEGRYMARVMSFAMTVLMLVPMLAPTIGQTILAFAGWRTIFIVFLFFAVIVVTWFGLRMPETLPIEKRTGYSLKRIFNAIKEISAIRSTMGFALASGLLNGIFLGYLNSSQQIFQDQYQLGDLFPLIFATISLSLALASILNARLVIRYGMRKLVQLAIRIEMILALIFFGLSIVFSGQPPLWSLLTYLMMFFFCIGILFGNLNAMAMQPLGHLAGVGAAVLGFLSTLISMILGTIIGQSYNGTVFALASGMVLLSMTAYFAIKRAIHRLEADDPA